MAERLKPTIPDLEVGGGGEGGRGRGRVILLWTRILSGGSSNTLRHSSC